MTKIFKLIALSLILTFSVPSQAQVKDAIKDIFTSETSKQKESDTLDKAPDSTKILLLKQSLEESKLNEAQARMELEQFKLSIQTEDSIKLAKRQRRIDSIRSITVGAPVIAHGDTLFYIYTKKGGYSASQRAKMSSEKIEAVGKKLNFDPSLVGTENGEVVTDIMYDDYVIHTVTDSDALWEGISRDSLTTLRKDTIVAQLEIIKHEHGVWQVIKRVLLLLLVIVIQAILFKLTIWAYEKLKIYIVRLKDTKLKPLYFQSYEVLNTEKQVRILVTTGNIIKYVFMFTQLLISVPIIFSIFPKTKGLALTLLGYVIDPIKSILWGIINYIPNLITIIIIWYAVRALVKLMLYIAKELESGNLKFKNFYPEWAMPTFQIIRFLLYAFMIAMIYNYLPGSDSGVFQGISVFVGIIISLGSTTLIANLMSGFVITYMRPFQIGDTIKLNDIIGIIIEKTPLVVRIRTPKNEIVTIPNSSLMTSQTFNYTASAEKYGLVVYSDITFGYDVPWQQLHELMIKAALQTKYIESEPKPFVLQRQLGDWYVVYQINAYTKSPQFMASIYSELHQNIMDLCHDAGIEVASPHLMGVRNYKDNLMPNKELEAWWREYYAKKKEEEALKAKEAKEKAAKKGAKAKKTPSKNVAPKKENKQE